MNLIFSHLEDVLSCSFDEPCPWNGLGTWKKSLHDMDNSSFFEGIVYVCSVACVILVLFRQVFILAILLEQFKTDSVKICNYFPFFSRLFCSYRSTVFGHQNNLQSLQHSLSMLVILASTYRPSVC